MPPGPWVVAVPAAALGQAPARSAAPGQGQPHRRPQALRPRPRLHLPERRRAHLLRHPLRGRLHADRHHRRDFARRSRRRSRIDAQARSPISAHAASALFRAAGRARTMSSGPIPACARCSTTARRRPQAATRDYVLKLDAQAGAAPLVACSAARSPPTAGSPSRRSSSLCARLPAARGALDGAAPLPGGDFAVDGVGIDRRACRRDADLARPRTHAPSGARLWRRASAAGRELTARADWPISDGRFRRRAAPRREVDYLCDHEWARHADDVLWRRTKLGLHLSAEERAALARWFDDAPCDRSSRFV